MSTLRYYDPPEPEPEEGFCNFCERDGGPDCPFATENERDFWDQPLETCEHYIG